MKMETQNILDLEVGNKEAQKLTPEKVKIVAVEIVEIGDKKISKVVCHCKHPKKEEPISISSVKYENKGKLDTVGLWADLDEDGKIRKGGALAVLLTFCNAINPKALIGKEIDTSEDEKGYLCLKAY